MAFPALEDITSGSYPFSNTHDIAYPATVNDGDLLILATVNDGNRTTTGLDTAGWTVLSDVQGSVGIRCAIAYLYADGTEAGTFTVGMDPTSNEGRVSVIFRLSGTADPATQAPELTIASDPGSTTPDCPASVSPLESKEYLFIAWAGTDDNPTYIAYPSGYSNTGTNLSVTGDVSSGWATLESETATAENPGAFTIGASESSHAATIMVHPGDAATSIIPQVAYHSNIILG